MHQNFYNFYKLDSASMLMMVFLTVNNNNLLIVFPHLLVLNTEPYLITQHHIISVVL